MAIFIRSNHLEISEVESAIYNLDNSVIDFETLQSIGKKRVSVCIFLFCEARKLRFFYLVLQGTLSDEEMSMIRGHADLGPEAPPLDVPEQFMLVRICEKNVKRLTPLLLNRSGF